MFCCCRAGHSVWKTILSLWYTKDPVISQKIDGNVTILESVSLDKTIIKYKVWDDISQVRLMSPLEAIVILYTKVESPWLWVGAESIFGRADLTNLFERYLVYGNKISQFLLKKRHPLYYSWKALDPVTFKEVDFPYLGITIDDPRMERHTEKSEEVKII
jgi:hypothetical protein